MPQGFWRLALVVSMWAGVATAAPSYVDPGVKTAVDADGSASVLVSLRGPRLGLLDALDAAGAKYEIRHAYGHFPVLHLRTDARGIESMRSSPLVSHINVDRRRRPVTETSVPFIGADDGPAAGTAGAGTSVAILDTPIAYWNGAFGDCPEPGAPGCSVQAWENFVDGADLEDLTQREGHGTNVAGIVNAVAPGARLLGLNVFHWDDEEMEPRALDSDVLAAMDWVIDNRAAFRIVAVNLSLGGYPDPPRACVDTAFDLAVERLVGAGVVVAAASGNHAAQARLHRPSCVPGAVSVAAVFDTETRPWQSTICEQIDPQPGELACFANADASLDIAAPGVWIDAGGINDYSGTSMAAPHVAGAVAVAQHAIEVRDGQFADAATIRRHLQISSATVQTRIGPLPSLRLDGVHTPPWRATRAAGPFLDRAPATEITADGLSFELNFDEDFAAGGGFLLLELEHPSPREVEYVVHTPDGTRAGGSVPGDGPDFNLVIGHHVGVGALGDLAGAAVRGRWRIELVDPAGPRGHVFDVGLYLCELGDCRGDRANCRACEVDADCLDGWSCRHWPDERSATWCARPCQADVDCPSSHVCGVEGECEPRRLSQCLGDDVIQADTCGQIAGPPTPCPFGCSAGDCIGCDPAANRLCVGRDVVSIDACGRVEAVVTTCLVCEDGACLGDSCEPDAGEDDDWPLSAARAEVGRPYFRNHCDDAEDWSIVELTADTFYDVETWATGATADTQVDLFDPVDVTWLAGDDDGGGGVASLLRHWSPPFDGTYLLRVERFAGWSGPHADYALVMREACDDDGAEHDDTAADAVTIRADGTPLDRQLCDPDWFALDLVVGQRVDLSLSDSRAEGEAPPHLRLYDRDGELLAAADNTDALEWTAPAEGRIFLEVTADTYGGDRPYALTATAACDTAEPDGVPCPPAVCTPDAYEPDDTARSAGILEIGVPSIGNHCDDTADWRRVALSADRAYDIETYPVGQLAVPALAMFDAATGQVIADRIDFRPSTSGDYLVQVSSGDGGVGAHREYQLLVRDRCIDDASEPNDQWTTARPLRLDGQPVIRGQCDVDWFWLTAHAGIAVALSAESRSSDADPVIELFGHDGITLLASDSGNGEVPQSSRLVWTPVIDGKLFVRVTASDGMYGGVRGYVLSAEEGQPEICDGRDNDLDGAIDEGRLNACGDCGSPPPEICNNLDDDCDGEIDEGALNACGRCGPVAFEGCNGLDDDCDGEVDEGQLNACGACGMPPAEICDGVDDDCDGAIDEGTLNACGQCGQPPIELCNGADDDCDGVTDEGVANACGGCGSVPAERCDGVDDDCDGLTDEGVLNACRRCGAVPPETCNGIDDNCDGVVDEHCTPDASLMPDASAPDAALPDATLPDAIPIDAALPDAARSDAIPPDAFPPDTAAPDTAAPDTAAPDTAAPDTAASDTAAPDTAAPDTAVPDTAVPDTMLRDAARLDGVIADAEIPDAVRPRDATQPTPDAQRPTPDADRVDRRRAGNSRSGCGIAHGIPTRWPPVWPTLLWIGLAVRRRQKPMVTH